MQKLASLPEWTLVVVADEKTPEWELPGVHFLSAEVQVSLCALVHFRQDQKLEWSNVHHWLSSGIAGLRFIRELAPERTFPEQCGVWFDKYIIAAVARSKIFLLGAPTYLSTIFIRNIRVARITEKVPNRSSYLYAIANGAQWIYDTNDEHELYGRWKILDTRPDEQSHFPFSLVILFFFFIAHALTESPMPIHSPYDGMMKHSI